jgi:DNA recombination protein RmuC
MEFDVHHIWAFLDAMPPFGPAHWTTIAAASALAVALGRFSVRAVLRATQAEITGLREALAALDRERAVAGAAAARVPELEQRISALTDRMNAETRRAENLDGQLRAARAEQEARLEELRLMGGEIERKFGALAHKALSGNAESFLKLVSERFEKHNAAAEADLGQRQKAIESMMKPVAETLSKFEARVGEIERAREGAYGAITTQIRTLAEGQTALKGETARLVQALRQPKTRGRWGEFQLRQVFEMAGMVEHVDFLTEHHIATDAARLRPDAIVRLPGGKSIVVDAKTPLDGYLAAVEAEGEQAREDALKAHVRHVRSHVANLSRKEYWNALDVTPDFVVMFVPGDAFYSAAIEIAPDLFEDAIRNRVLISTPTTLIALIKAIAYGWQQEKLARNAQEVATLARDLYERIGRFGEHLAGVGKALRQAVEKYNASVGSLEGRVLPQARKFERLGVVGPGTELTQLPGVEIEPRELSAAEFASGPELPAPRQRLA